MGVKVIYDILSLIISALSLIEGAMRNNLVVDGIDEISQGARTFKFKPLGRTYHIYVNN